MFACMHEEERCRPDWEDACEEEGGGFHGGSFVGVFCAWMPHAWLWWLQWVGENIYNNMHDLRA